MKTNPHRPQGRLMKAESVEDILATPDPDEIKQLARGRRMKTIVDLSNGGMSITNIAATLDIGHCTVERDLARYGVLWDRRRALEAKQREQNIPTEWQKEMLTKFKQQIPKTFKKAAHEIGITWKKKRLGNQRFDLDWLLLI